IPGTLSKKFDEVVAIVRRYSTTPVVAAELAKLKSGGVSQSMFPVTTSSGTKAACRQFASKGTCRFGASCKFSHAATPGGSQADRPQAAGKPGKPCAYCLIKGHTAAECRGRQRDLAALGPGPQPTALVVQEQQAEGKEQPAAAPASQTPPAEPPSVFGFVMTITEKHNISNWVM